MVDPQTQEIFDNLTSQLQDLKLLGDALVVENDEYDEKVKCVTTTIQNAIEAQKLKYKIFYYEPKDLSIINDKVVANGCYVEFNYSNKRFYKILNQQKLELTQCRYILIRQDHPFNLEYISITYILEKIKNKFYLLEEFILEQIKNDNKVKTNKFDQNVLIHGHCHQKSQDRMKGLTNLLSELKINNKMIDSSCCGMAGSFVYDSKNYEVSKKMANLSLIPAINNSDEAYFIISNGTSCRHQISDLSHKNGKHISEYLFQIFKTLTYIIF